MNFYRYHVFFCVNQRSNGEDCCNDKNATQLREYAKARIKTLEASNKLAQGLVRINQAGCLNRCAAGPVIVIYPEGIWYSYFDQADIDEIIDHHILAGEKVERLLIPTDSQY